MFENCAREFAVAAALLALTALAARPAAADPVVVVVTPDALRIEADRALAEGRFAAARAHYETLLARDPRDAHALREAGRAAHAMRDFTAAATLLDRAAALTTTPDPELHYLRGEALWALAREAEARLAYARARREIGETPTERMPRLWLAQIDGRLGDRAAADAIYDAMAAAAPTDAEVALAQAAMHASAREWIAAERAVRRLLAVVPSHRRALEVLAWIEEARGEIASELELREQLARDSVVAGPVRDYCRALERSGDWAGALATYRHSEGLAGGATDVELERALRRLDQRMAIEIAGGAVAKSDPGANALGASAGVAIPFGRAHHLALGVWQERVSKAGRDGSAGEVFAGVALRGVATSAVAGARLGAIDFSRAGADPMTHSSTAPSAFGQVRATTLGGHVELGVDGDLNAVWRETPTAEIEGGHVDAVTAHVWGNALSRQLVIDTGSQLRRLHLAAEDAGDPTATQLFVWGGLDWAPWRDFSRQAAGEIFDDNLLQPTSLASSVTTSYRHYEVGSRWNTAFGERLGMTSRTTVDQASLILRGAILDGRIAVELRGGLGYDWSRAVWIDSAASALWLATGVRSRLTLTIDYAKESAHPVPGERLFGGMTYHVDL